MSTNYRKLVVNQMKYKIGGLVFRTKQEIADRFLLDLKTVTELINRNLPAPNGYLIESIKYKQGRPDEE